MVHTKSDEPPPRKAAAQLRLLPLAFTVSIILCLVGWVYFLHNLNLEIILVRDVVTLATLFATTLVVLWQFLHTLFLSD